MLALGALLGATASGCGGETGADVAPTDKVTVVMYGGAYHPAHVRIEAGSRVTWFNRVDESTTAETDGVGFFDVDRRRYGVDKLFDIHTVQRGEAESVLFQRPGIYRYHSSFDQSMRGTVEVVPKDG